MGRIRLFPFSRDAFQNDARVPIRESRREEVHFLFCLHCFPEIYRQEATSRVRVVAGRACLSGGKSGHRKAVCPVKAGDGSLSRAPGRKVPQKINRRWPQGTGKGETGR